jgi:hypothetical protein
VSALPLGLPGAGIDIVDLSLTDPARSERLAPKMLAPSEYALRPAEMSFHIFLWLCWSVKEAVYKFRRGTFFQPTRIVLDALNRVGDLHVRSVVTSDYILSVVDTPGLVFEVAPLSGDPSEEVRSLIKKGFPDWERRPVSFSHHGSYMAYSLQDADGSRVGKTDYAKRKNLV